MQRRDLAIGIIILFIIALIVFFVQRRNQQISLPEETPSATPKIEEKEAEIEGKFNIQIPENVEKANLHDTTGRGYGAVATRESKAGEFSLTILADLPDPEDGRFYQAWLTKDGDSVSLGQLRIAKGGYLIDYTSATDLSSYKVVTVSLERVFDNKIEEVILQGSF